MREAEDMAELVDQHLSLSPRVSVFKSPGEIPHLGELNLLVSVGQTGEDKGSSRISQRELGVDQNIPAASCKVPV